jgi:Glycosyl hydrolases family 6
VLSIGSPCADSPRGMRGSRARALLAAPLMTLMLAALAPAAAQADGKGTVNPFVGHQQFMDCEAGHVSASASYSAWYHLYHSSGKSRTLLAKIAEVPVVKWLTAGPSDPIRPLSRQTERFIANVDHPPYGGADCSHRLHYSAEQWKEGAIGTDGRDAYVGDYPVMAFRALNDKSCGADVDPSGKYKARVQAVAHQLSLTYDSPEPYQYWNAAPPPFAHWRSSGRSGAMLIEPDAIGLMSARASHCVHGAQKTKALALIHYAVTTFAAIRGLAVYIDSGAGDWVHADEAVSMLREAGVSSARGFVLNGSHFDRTKPEIAFGNKVARRLGTHFVVNTAENAHGSLPKSRWHGLPAGIATNCNPMNAGLGSQPTSHTGSSYADAFLWVSRPGLSSNDRNRCDRGPTTNVWFQGQALLLARRAAFGKASWPSKGF